MAAVPTVIPFAAMAANAPEPAAPSALRRAVRRALGVLPPARRDAARIAGRATIDLLRGREPATWATGRGEPPLDPRLPTRARVALADGRFADALEAACAVLVLHPRHAVALNVRGRALAELGELSAAYAAIRQARAVTGTSHLDELERRVVGWLLVTDPEWLPRLAGPACPVRDPVEGRVLLLSGDAATAERVAETARAAGLDPLVVQVAGPNARVEGEARSAAGWLLLDMGAAYPSTAPPDRWLDDLAWLVSRVVEEGRPAAVLVAGGTGDAERAAIALALRARHAVPVIVEREPSRPETPGAPELERRRGVARAGRQAAADAVVDPGSTEHLRTAFEVATGRSADRA
jgi:hypothetical protein